MDIDSFVSTIEKQKLTCEGIIVLQHGEKIAEHRWIPENPRNIFSVSKSFVSIAIGMAVDRGKLSLASRLVDVFPKLGRRPGKRLAALTLEYLLTMTRGYKAFSHPATTAEALAQPLTYQPGEYFAYDNASTFLASAMFTFSMGLTVREFLLDALFRPLGIPDPEWPQSPDGHTVGATDLVLTTSNLAAFGQFLLQRGEWKGKQLVSPAWIDSAGRPQTKTGWKLPDQDLGYGFYFWPCRHGAYRADGKDGQFVVVHPLKDAVIAINSNEPNAFPILYAVWDNILPLL
ncbi:MAG: beta-lactamase family protein [Treponema sp.]|jgi:CubicO group peptidase (beta-lactamase class C family)|nr:beta-lactamase family protein [Treponema sp.]